MDLKEQNGETSPLAAEPEMKPHGRTDALIGALLALVVLLAGIAAALELLGRSAPEVEKALARASSFPITLEQIEEANLSMREALYWEDLGDGTVKCGLCPFNCVIAQGERGVCKVRANMGGKLRCLTYGRPVAVRPDPIEKKPLFHVLPRAQAFSIATVGCNLGCLFCQNWEISQSFPEESRFVEASPERIVDAAQASGCETIAYTYTEPTVFFEYMLDTAKLAKKRGLKNLWITCGNINPEPLAELCEVMDAANVDLKGFD
ncbi:MAG: radical SAM protein [Planctomycetota bacterium]